MWPVRLSRRRSSEVEAAGGLVPPHRDDFPVRGDTADGELSIRRIPLEGGSLGVLDRIHGHVVEVENDLAHADSQGFNRELRGPLEGPRLWNDGQVELDVLEDEAVVGRVVPLNAWLCEGRSLVEREAEEGGLSESACRSRTDCSC